MNIHTEELDHAIVVSLEGRLNADSAVQLEEQIFPLPMDHKHLLLDMSRVNYLSSAGLRVLLLLYRRVLEHNSRIALIGLSEEVRDIMAMTGFLDLFTIFDSRGDGLRSMRAAS